MLEVTSASKWLKPYVEGVPVMLASGNVIKMRPVALDELMRNGSIPDLLTPVASTALYEGVFPEDVAKDQFKLINQMTELAATILPIVVVEPKIYIGNGPLPEGMIKLEHISVADKLSIFNLAIQPVNVLEAFRNQQVGNVESLPVNEN